MHATNESFLYPSQKHGGGRFDQGEPMDKRTSQDRFLNSTDVPIEPGRTALLIIDMQYVDAHPDYGIAKMAKERGKFDRLGHLFETLPATIKNIQRLQKAFRGNGIEVLFVKIQSYTKDGRDLSPSYREKGISAPPGSKEAEILEELAPLPNEVVLTKLSTSAFTSSPIDSVLRYMGIDSLVVTGVNTNYCVETAVRDAYDRGYKVALVSDGCTTIVKEHHDTTLEELDDIMCKVMTTDEVLQGVQTAE